MTRASDADVEPDQDDTAFMNNYTMWILVLLFAILLLIILFGTGVLGG